MLETPVGVTRRSYAMTSLYLIGGAFVVAITPAAVLAQPPITAIEFSPNGKTVAIGSQASMELRSWPSLKTKTLFDSQLGNINDFAFSHDGKQMAAAGGVPGEKGIVELYSLPNGSRLKKQLKLHGDQVFSVAWQKGDAVLATASLDGLCKLIDSRTGKIVQTFTGHSRALSAVSFLMDQPMLVTAGVDHSVRVWNTSTGGIVRTLTNHTKPVHDLAVRPSDGSTLPMLASVSDDRTVRLWQPTIGRMVRFARLPSIPLAVAWTPDGSQIVVSCQDGRVRIIDPDTVEVVDELKGVEGWAYCVAVHPTDKSILVGGRKGQLKTVIH